MRQLSAQELVNELRIVSQITEKLLLRPMSPDSISEEFIDQTGTVRWSQTTPLNGAASAFAGLTGEVKGEV